MNLIIELSLPECLSLTSCGLSILHYLTLDDIFTTRPLGPLNAPQETFPEYLSIRTSVVHYKDILLQKSHSEQKSHSQRKGIMLGEDTKRSIPVIDYVFLITVSVLLTCLRCNSCSSQKRCQTLNVRPLSDVELKSDFQVLIDPHAFLMMSAHAWLAAVSIH